MNKTRFERFAVYSARYNTSTETLFFVALDSTQCITFYGAYGPGAAHRLRERLIAGTDSADQWFISEISSYRNPKLVSPAPTLGKTKCWIGVDLDGTLAHYDGWKGIEHVGAPIPAMVARVKQWLREGKAVRIFTGRVAPAKDGRDPFITRKVIEDWCKKHIGHVLPVTCTKDFGMTELWDDRAVAVKINDGAAARYTEGGRLEISAL